VLAAGQATDIQVLAKPDRTGEFTGTVSAKAPGGYSTEGNTVNVAVRAPVLAFDAEAPASAHIGFDMPIKFTVKNTGDMACSDTTISARVPEGTTFVRADNGGTASDAGNVTWNLGSLPAGDARTVVMVAKNSGAGTVQVSGSAAGACS